jgi:hypothetical protein
MGTPQGRETAGAAAEPTTTPTEVRRLVRSVDQLDVLVELVDARLGGDTVMQDGPEPRLRLTFGRRRCRPGGRAGGTPPSPGG